MKHETKVLHVLTSKAFGGLELYTLQLIEKQLENGKNCALYCLPNTKVKMEADKRNIPVFLGHKQKRISLKDIVNLFFIIKNNNYTILHTHSRFDVWLVSLTKVFVKKIKHIYSLYMDAPSKKSLIHNFIYSKIDTVISSSEILNEKIKKNFPINSEKIKLVRYGREINNQIKNHEETNKLKKELNISQDKIIFGTMCRIDPYKGIKEIATSLEYLHQNIKEKICLIFIGDPTLLKLDENSKPIYETESAEVYNWLMQYSLDEKNLGTIQMLPYQKDYNKYLSLFDVFILATYKETYSLAVLDAMNLNVPVIGTNSGGTPEQVLHLERGFLVSAKSSQEIAKAIIYYVEQPQKISEHGSKANAWMNAEHNWLLSLDLLEKIYLSLLTEN